MSQKDKVASSVTADVVDVTPDMAAGWLETNKENRPLRSRKLKSLIAAMRDGKFQLHGQAIQFDDKGRLIDGQHRLWAVVESQATVPMLVVKGLSRDTQYVIDRHAARTAGDSLAMRGVPNANVIAAAARLIIAYEADHAAFPQALKQEIPTDEIDNFTQKNRDGLIHAMRMTDKWRGLMSHSRATAIYFILAKTDRKAVVEFGERLLTGANLSAGSPILALRNRLLAEDHTSVSRSDVVLLFVMVIKAWNAWRSGRELSSERHAGATFRWRPKSAAKGEAGDVFPSPR